MYCNLAILAAVLFHALSAAASAPQVRTQGPGFYRIMVGDFEITALSDGTHPFPIDTVIQNVSKQDIALDLSRASLAMPVQGSINAFLINTGSKLILIDSGAGVLYGACCGQLMANLRAAGYTPDQVDEVLLTHLHKDHVGGIILDGKMAFPNAVLRVSRTEAAYWLTPANKGAAPPFLGSFFDSAVASVAPYIDAGQFKPFADDEQIETGIRAAIAPGHTPGHAIYYIESRADTLLVWGDIVHVAAIQLQQLLATVEYDNDAAAAQRSRRELLQMAATKHYLIGAAHIAFPGLGHMRANGTTYDWIPVNYDTTLSKSQ